VLSSSLFLSLSVLKGDIFEGITVAGVKATRDLAGILVARSKDNCQMEQLAIGCRFYLATIVLRRHCQAWPERGRGVEGQRGGEAERQMIRAHAITDARHEQQQPCRLKGRKRAGNVWACRVYYHQIPQNREITKFSNPQDSKRWMM
jgi:hypothetical protein